MGCGVYGANTDVCASVHDVAVFFVHPLHGSADAICCGAAVTIVSVDWHVPCAHGSGGGVCELVG